MPRLIINADDFGLTPGINRAIAELHDAGALTSATLMASGSAFDHAVSLALARPTLGVGCHIVLADGLPVSPPRSIPTLIARNGRTMRPRLRNFLAALILHGIDPTDIEREAIAQVQKLQRAGIAVTHLDAHKHTHVAPPVAEALLRAAAQTGVGAIRNPFEQPWSFTLADGNAARTSQIRLLQPLQRGFLHRPAIHTGQVHTTDGTVGISATGHLNERSLRSLLAAMPEGTWELVCHPGYNDPDLDEINTRLRASRDTERQALLAVLSPGGFSRDASHLPPPELIHYGDLTSRKPGPTQTTEKLSTDNRALTS